jgi:Na+-translocating ferredoxin:NAD+ oxidoreductase RnfC subunit
MRNEGIKFVQQKPVKVHPIKDGRRVPLTQLIQKLSLKDFDVPARFNPGELTVKTVKIPLKQHIGETSTPIVKEGENVESGQLIASVPKGKLGAKIHSSISGKVKEVTEVYIKIDS